MLQVARNSSRLRIILFSSNYIRNRSFVSTSIRWTPINMEEFDCSQIRNFGIIAHIDHGKSTLADRLLELTGTISQSNGANKQVLDKLKVERERGITVKAQTASMLYGYEGKKYLLNLIDTPVCLHVYSLYWYSRCSLLGSCRFLVGGISLDGCLPRSFASRGRDTGNSGSIYIFLNKIDLPTAAPERIAAQMQSTFDISPADILQVSAKTGQGVTELLQAIIERVPSPATADRSAKMRALLFDSQYDRYRGVVSMISLQSGQIRKGASFSALRSSMI
ncbi:hypothetical protein FRC12_010220 [Ceratobasidium sp. 428]|nr:hypothetical protein FRC12_010220 [Ceratobasidium sp. 428]